MKSDAAAAYYMAHVATAKERLGGAIMAMVTQEDDINVVVNALAAVLVEVANGAIDFESPESLVGMVANLAGENIKAQKRGRVN